MKRSGKFTIVDLLAMVLLSSLVIAMMFLTGSCSRRITYKSMLCGTHLAGLGKCLQLYYADYNDAFPAIHAAVSDAKTGLGFTGTPDTKKNVYELDGTFPQDSLSLMVYKDLISWDIFLCPSTETRLKDRSDPTDMYGFGAGTSPVNAHRNFIDYGLHIPQRYTAPGIEHKAWINQNAESSLAILADRPPAPAMLATQWGPNHPKDGANILFFDGTVKRMNADNGTAAGPGGTVYRNVLGGSPGNIHPNNIYAKDMGPDIGAPPDIVTPGPVGPGDITPPGPTDSRFDSVIYWRSNP
jgi:prepilin-type processing-associated H-X9-DG protein